MQAIECQVNSIGLELSEDNEWGVKAGTTLPVRQIGLTFYSGADKVSCAIDTQDGLTN